MSILIDNVEAYQHVTRFGSKEVDGLLDGRCLIQEKLDGANLTVTVTPESGLVVCTRRACIHKNGEPKTGFRGAVEYVLNHDGLLSFVHDNPDLVLRGEWLTKHVVKYSQDVMKQYYVFDVQMKETGEYLPEEEYRKDLLANDIKMVPVVGYFDKPNLDHIRSLADSLSFFGASRKEGVVVKRYGFVNRYGRTVWGKMVNEEFIQHARAPKEAVAYDSETKFAETVISKEVVLKTIQMMKDMRAEQGKDDEITVEDMFEVLGRTWDTVLHEELIDFIKKNKVHVFNFAMAQKITTNYIRDFALAYFNGI